MAITLDKIDVDTGHVDMIHDAQMNMTGTKLATCAGDRKIRIFDVNLTNGSVGLTTELSGHAGPIWQVAWAHTDFGQLLASCSFDRRVIFWREKADTTWERVYTYEGHSSSVNSVCWGPRECGLLLACASSDGSISILSCRHGQINRWEVRKVLDAHVLGCNAISWAPSSYFRTVTESENDISPKTWFVSGGCDTTVKIWKEVDEMWVLEAKLTGHMDWVRDVAWCPAIGQSFERIASCSQDRRVIIWTQDHGQEKKENWTMHVICDFDDVVWHVSWNITGDILAVSGGDNQVSLWKHKQNKANLDDEWECISDLQKQQRSSVPSIINNPRLIITDENSTTKDDVHKIVITL